MISFWVVAGVLAACAAGLVLQRAAAAARGDSPDPTSAVYARQLAEIDELAERGLIAEGERHGARTEAARRLLHAADSQPAAWRADGSSRKVLLIILIAASAATLALYVLVGRPGLSDQPFAGRLAVWRAADPSSLAAPELAAVLQRMTRERPNDPEGFRFLAIADGASQDPAGAVRAMRHAVKLAPARADLWELLGEAEVAANGGDVAADAQAAFRQAVRLDTHAFAARYHLAQAQVASGDKTGGLAAWRALLADMPAGDPRRADLVQSIAEAEGHAPPPPLAAPDQQAMIQGMVQRLAQRLAANPDDPPGWVRLVRAYAVLGDTAKRDATLQAARARYAGHADTLAQLANAARAEPMR